MQIGLQLQSETELMAGVVSTSGAESITLPQHYELPDHPGEPGRILGETVSCVEAPDPVAWHHGGLNE